MSCVCLCRSVSARARVCINYESFALFVCLENRFTIKREQRQTEKLGRQPVKQVTRQDFHFKREIFGSFFFSMTFTISFNNL